MTDKIKVLDFVNKYINAKTIEEKDSLIRNIITRKYSSFVEKTTFLNTMANKNVYEKNGVRYIDEVSNYINFVISVLVLHTNLEFKADNRTIYDDYDSLQELNLVGLIFASIGSEEIEEMSMINDMIKQRIVTEEQNVISGLGKQVTRFSYLVGEKLNTGIESLAKSLEKIDDKKLNKFKDTLYSVVKNVKSVEK